MSPRSFDPDELEQHPDLDGASEELERYAHRIGRSTVIGLRRPGHGRR